MVDKARITQANKSKNEKAKYIKELRISNSLKRMGFRIELREGARLGATYDIRINNINADLKSITTHNNIGNYARKATKKQGAKLTIFEINGKLTPAMQNEFKKLTAKGLKGLYYEKGKRIYHKF